MSSKIAITGMGIISALGVDITDTLQKLKANQTGIKKLEQLPSIHTNRMYVGEVSLSNNEMATRLDLPADHNFTRTALLGTMAARQALENGNINLDDGKRTGLISATTVGGMDKTELLFNDFADNTSTRKYISSHHAGDSTQKITQYLGIKGYSTTISTACSSAANAIILGARLLQTNTLDRVVVGGVDALSKFTINGFNSLMLASESVCKPFDEHRSGLNLGEGAAYLILERDDNDSNSNKVAYLSGYANANDAFHQTASSPTGEGAFLAMKQAIEMAGLQPPEIDYINAHGTATPNNDLSESIALKRIFNDSVPDFSSTKAFTGHTLAAAGAIEAVFSILSIHEQQMFANLNFETPIIETGLVPVTFLESKSIKHVLSNSFGFGGNCSTLIFCAL